jgi:hypothetical protein
MNIALQPTIRKKNLLAMSPEQSSELDHFKKK